jgi:hypothetical protein
VISDWPLHSSKYSYFARRLLTVGLASHQAASFPQYGFTWLRKAHFWGD